MPPRNPPRRIAAGGYHSAYVDEHGNAGYGQDQNVLTPRCVKGAGGYKGQVLAVAAGDAHTILQVIQNRGGAMELHTFGSNETGQLGLPWVADQGDKGLPTPVDMKAPREAAAASLLTKAVRLAVVRKQQRMEDAEKIDKARVLFAELSMELSPPADAEQRTPPPSTGTAPP